MYKTTRLATPLAYKNIAKTESICYNIYTPILGLGTHIGLSGRGGCSFYCFNWPFTSFIPLSITFTRDIFKASAHSCKSFAVSSEMRIFIFIFLGFSTGGRPVLGDTFSPPIFASAIIIILPLQKLKSFCEKSFSCQNNISQHFLPNGNKDPVRSGRFALC